MVSTRYNGIAVVLCALLVSGALMMVCPVALASGGSDSLGARSDSTDWYFAEGTTRAGFTTYIAVMNPSGDAADVTFTYMLGSGDPVVRTHKVAATSRFTIDISLDVGPGRDVATFVHSTKPVVAERPMYFIYHATDAGSGAGETGGIQRASNSQAAQPGWDGGHDSLGATSLAKQWFFAEGTTRADFVTYLAVLNPNADAADVTFTYLLGSGQPVVRKHPVAAKSRFTVDVAADLGSQYRDRDVSTVVESTLPVVAERPMYFNYEGRWDGGHDSLGARSLSTEWDFAEGTTRDDFVTYLTIANPGEAAAEISCRYMLGNNGEIKEVSHAVPGNCRFTIDVSADVGPGRDVSTTIRSNVPVAAERPMYFNYMGKWDGGHDSPGATSLGDIWEFAEGTTRTGYATYLAIMNPGDLPEGISITYALASGETKWCSHLVQPHSRYTLDVSTDVGPGQDVASFVRGSNVVVERPMYFSAPGKGVSICIDAGHSGRDGSEVDPATGLNVGDNTGAPNELQQNWDLAVKARRLLEEAGYTVVFTKQSVNDYLSLKQRADIGNTCDLMVRLHHDPSGFTGVMRSPANAARCPTSDPGRITVVDPGVAAQSDRLARSIAPRMGLTAKDDTGGTSQGNSTPPGHPTCLIGSLLSRVPVVCIENKYSTSDDYVRGLVEGITDYLR